MNENNEQVEQNVEVADNQNINEEVDYKALYEKAQAERDNYKNAMQKERVKVKEVKQVASEKTNESESYKQEFEQLMEMHKATLEKQAQAEAEKEKLSIKEEQKNRLKAMNVDLESQKSLINLVGYDKIATLSDNEIKQAGFKFKKAEIQKENKEEKPKTEINSGVEKTLEKFGIDLDKISGVLGN